MIILRGGWHLLKDLIYRQLHDRIVESILASILGGMVVKEGARKRLTELERNRFLDEAWPQINEKITRLGLPSEELLNSRSHG
ncbi:MAG: hypothetical protein QGH99_05515 [Pseudomonadales bacterium]|nr:hypothetical protein [Gammaproteobacteria bacterium]MDP6024490.1 hypothetical protein [Pseudomonadales bacterium]MDP6316897.1 hypothetical protein [Pseudomonadales bacterium]MDP7313858.1 hypothetical protein [Pseudomonadales bacterium]MDP7576403.1 hypothetical protein [Pseudomonadales bacterium]|tara:strand:- start:3302 stop:3550 length:249 start_codon:yes stop_codon:yes gene_type:complete